MKPFLALTPMETVYIEPQPQFHAYRVSVYLKARTDYQTAQQIADAVGLSRDQVRTAVSYLLKRGKVERQTPSRYAERGRVARQGYRWTR